MKTTTPILANDLGPAFEMREDGSLFIPYGDFGHRLGRQRVDATAAQRMGGAMGGALGSAVGRLMAAIGRPRRFPIYIGHPDVPGRGAEFPDKAAYGWGTAIVAENDGMRIAVKWTAEGERLIRDGHFAYHSPYWEAEEDREARVVRPVRMISVGLTNNPNIPVPPLANDDQGEEAAEEDSTEGSETDPDDTMKKELAALLGKDETTAEEDLLALVKTLMENQKPAEDAAAENDDAAAGDGSDRSDRADLSDGGEEAAQVSAENDALVQVRRERVGMAIDTLCLAGVLTVAGRAQAENDLLACANDDDYATTLERLRTASPVLKTAGVTDDLAESGGAVRAENDKAAITKSRQEKMNAEMAANGGNFNAAWKKLSRRHPELFV